MITSDGIRVVMITSDYLGSPLFLRSASGSIRTFVAERDIAAHELRARLYRLPAYFAARSLAEATLHFGFALLFGLLTYDDL